MQTKDLKEEFDKKFCHKDSMTFGFAQNVMAWDVWNWIDHAIQSAIKEREEEIMEIVSKELYTNGAIRIDGLNRISKKIRKLSELSKKEKGGD